MLIRNSLAIGDNKLVSISLSVAVLCCVLSENVFVYLLEVTFLLEIWMLATLDISLVISDSNFHQTQVSINCCLL